MVFSLFVRDDGGVFLFFTGSTSGGCLLHGSNNDVGMALGVGRGGSRDRVRR